MLGFIAKMYQKRAGCFLTDEFFEFNNDTNNHNFLAKFHQYRTAANNCNSVGPNPVAVRPKACVCRRSLAGIVGSNPAQGMDVYLLLSVVCCQVEVSASGLSPIQRSPTECCVSVIVKPKIFFGLWYTTVAPWGERKPFMEGSPS